jgi:hypothetical protein
MPFMAEESQRPVIHQTIPREKKECDTWIVDNNHAIAISESKISNPVRA